MALECYSTSRGFGDGKFVTERQTAAGRREISMTVIVRHAYLKIARAQNDGTARELAIAAGDLDGCPSKSCSSRILSAGV
jgi:hypothetical protein